MSGKKNWSIWADTLENWIAGRAAEPREDAKDRTIPMGMTNTMLYL